MNDIVQSLNTALEGRYRILRQLGEGGMATVYLADDVKHGRRVAVKVLKPELAAVVGAERFLVEIKTTANLQHPNILPLFDSGTAGSFLFYVMPFVEGETLRDRLDRERQLPIEDAVHIISDVAGALDYAHRNGVVHRDIKPANILLREGKPLVADFGIALAIGAAGDGRMTETGLSLGTPHYMSPEQALGERGVGAPSDIYAIGCVLYEMLVGEPPYTGGSATAIVGKIIAGELSAPTKQRPSIPPHINDAIRKALEKLPADRFRSAQDFAKALREPGFRHGTTAPSSQATAASGPWKIAAFASGALVLLLGAGLAMTVRRPAPTGIVARFEAPFRDGQGPLEQRSSTFAISADGRYIAYKGSDEQQLGGSQIWIRRWDDLEARPVPGTDAAASVSLSPDGQQIAMTQGGQVKVISTAGGAARTVARGFGGYWAPDGYIYFSTIERDLRRVSVATGDSAVVRTAATRMEENILAHDMLPGNTQVLISISQGAEPTVMAVVDVRDGKTTVLGPGSWPRYAPTGHLLWIGPDGTLNAAPFNPRNLRLDPPTALVRDVVGYAFSSTGMFAYTESASGDSIPTNLVFVQKDGTRSNRIELSGTAWYPRFSRDGRRLAVGIGVDLTPGSRSDLWTYDLARGALTRVTFGGNNKFVPTWTPDGSRLTHSDGTTNENRLLSTTADGTGEVMTLMDVSERKFPTSWSPDGKFLAYYLGPQGTPTNSRDIWLLEMSGDSATPRPFVQTPFMERGAIFSPDGRWLAYVSDKAGKNGVYARPFPGPGNEETISVAGGSEPVWAPSGRELYYRHDDSLMVVSVDTRGTTLTVGAPRRLFRDPFMRDVGGSAGGVANYDISPSGDRFVMIESPTAASGGAHVKMTVVLNWFDDLRARTVAR